MSQETETTVAPVVQQSEYVKDERMKIFRRYVRIDEQGSLGDDGIVRMTASTDDAVQMGDWSESLSHDDGAVDMSAARALLVNHNPDQIAGMLSMCQVNGRECVAEAQINTDARMQSGITVIDAVRSGALRGVSIGYSYSRSDCTFNRESRVLRVNKWRLLEVSLTPIPADPAASVRSLPFDETTQANDGQEEEHRMSDTNAKPDLPGLDKAAIETEARAASIKQVREVAEFARSFGIDPVEVIGKSIDEVKDIALENARSALAEKAAPKAEVKVSVRADAADKWMDQASENITRYSTEQLLRQCAQYNGERVDDLSVHDLSSRAIRRLSFTRDAANKSTDSFSVLLGNTANKQLMNGFDRYTPIWDTFCTVKDATNFNTHNHVGVSTGRLVETPENVAYPEMDQVEGSYSSALAKWGATVSVSYEALVNDELGEIMRSFTRAGYAAGRTIERQVFYRLLNATWTNDTTTSVALGTAGNLDKVRAGLKGKLSPAGEKMELDGSILLVDPINRYNADAATGQLYGVSTGANAQGGSNAVRSVRVVDSTFVGDTALLAGALTTNYYMIADPMICDTVVVEFLRGIRAPQIQEFDAGAVEATKYKIMLPFQATVATHTDSAGNARVTGIQKATA